MSPIGLPIRCNHWLHRLHTDIIIKWECTSVKWADTLVQLKLDSFYIHSYCYGFRPVRGVFFFISQKYTTVRKKPKVHYCPKKLRIWRKRINVNRVEIRGLLSVSTALDEAPPGSPETSRMLAQYAATLPLTTVKLNLLWWEVNLKMSPNVPSPYVSLIHNYYYYYAWAITSSLDKTIIFIGLV